MTFSKILGFFFYGLAAAALAGLVLIELRAWMQNRRNPLARGPAARRFFRRACGAVLLASILILLRYPAADSLSPWGQLLKLAGCLLLCVVVLALAVWDLRAIRQEMKVESRRFVEQSARDLHEYLEEIADREKKTPPRG